MNFVPGFTPPSKQDESDLFFIFEKGKLLVKKRGDDYHIPDLLALKKRNLTPIHQQYIGCLNSRRCFAAEICAPNLSNESFIQLDLRALIQLLDDDLIWIAGRANQLIYWNQTHRYCGRCGSAVRHSPPAGHPSPAAGPPSPRSRSEARYRRCDRPFLAQGWPGDRAVARLSPGIGQQGSSRSPVS